jgi:hypothetical protein
MVLVCLVCPVGWECVHGKYPFYSSYHTPLISNLHLPCTLTRFDPFGPPGGPTDPGRGGRFPGRGGGVGRGRGGRGGRGGGRMPPPGGFGDPNPDHLTPPGGGFFS